MKLRPLQRRAPPPPSTRRSSLRAEPGASRWRATVVPQILIVWTLPSVRVAINTTPAPQGFLRDKPRMPALVLWSMEGWPREVSTRFSSLEMGGQWGRKTDSQAWVEKARRGLVPGAQLPSGTVAVCPDHLLGSRRGFWPAKPWAPRASSRQTRPLGADDGEGRYGATGAWLGSAFSQPPSPRPPCLCPSKHSLCAFAHAAPKPKCPPLAKLFLQRQTGMSPPLGSLL